MSFGDAGHRKLPLEQLIRVRDHGVGGEYARDMRQLGFAVPIDELVRARDHGVTVEFARDMAALGYTNLTLDNLIRIRDHGVTPDYAKALKALGYDRLAVEDLVMLRDQGLTCGADPGRERPRRHPAADRSAQVARALTAIVRSATAANG